MSKTPTFDAAISKTLDGVIPHSRTCAQCQQEFLIEAEDIAWYKKFQVPPPTLCHRCRYQRRMSHRINMLPIFYRRTCNVPGHTESMLSFYSQQNPVKVYDDSFYYGDGWDGLNFGRAANSTESFFGQFNELARGVPRQAIFKDPKGINCDYCIGGVNSKNCYYVATPAFSEDIQFSYFPFNSKQSVDTNHMFKCERGYECTNVLQCYNCNYCLDCENCVDSWFLFDCKNCTNCFGATNLHNKSYVFFNEQLSKEEYQRRLAGINTGDRNVLAGYKKQYEQLKQRAIYKNLIRIQVENCTGNDLHESKNCFESYLVSKAGENLRYVIHVDFVRDSMDVFGSSNSELMYESTGMAFDNDIKFSLMCRNSRSIEYSVECNNCQYVFGCIGLKNKKFCIFNQQYTEEEYWRAIDKLKTAMLARGEYGEFFSAKDSPCAYKDSNAAMEFPLTKQEVLARRWHWEDDQPSEFDLSAANVLQPAMILNDIAAVTDDILQKVLVCEKTGKPFRLTKFELDFYHQKKLPLPTVHPLQRIKDRFALQRPYRLWDTKCSKCDRNIHSGYDPDKKLTVYCESCYNAEVV